MRWMSSRPFILLRSARMLAVRPIKPAGSAFFALMLRAGVRLALLLALAELTELLELLQLLEPLELPALPFSPLPFFAAAVACFISGTDCSSSLICATNAE